jgi:hypothetical protein
MSGCGLGADLDGTDPCTGASLAGYPDVSSFSPPLDVVLVNKRVRHLREAVTALANRFPGRLCDAEIASRIPMKMIDLCKAKAQS